MQQKNGEMRLPQQLSVPSLLSFWLFVLDPNSYFHLLFSSIQANVEVTLRIVYQPQALFRIRPVNRCSATIAGMCILTITM
jgi:hypothetical protein